MSRIVIAGICMIGSEPTDNIPPAAAKYHCRPGFSTFEAHGNRRTHSFFLSEGS